MRQRRRARAVCEGICKMLDGSEFRVVARVMDKGGWFRQIPTASVDRRKAVTMLAGRFVRDNRLIMGKRAASQQGDRITQLTVAYLEARFNATFHKVWPCSPRTSGPSCSIGTRRACRPSDQCRPSSARSSSARCRMTLRSSWRAGSSPALCRSCWTGCLAASSAGRAESFDRA